MLSGTVLLLLPIAPLAQQGEREQWDVSVPAGPSSTVSFETTEGTWMNVDVSPEARTLIFDLLGCEAPVC